jgi:hypothetical protein
MTFDIHGRGDFIFMHCAICSLDCVGDWLLTLLCFLHVDLYLSYFDDWVDPDSILSVIYVLHIEVGEAIRNGRSYWSLLDNGTFFFKEVYVPPTTPELYWHLEPLPLPELDDPDWPLPDMDTSESYRTKIACEFRQVMKATMGSKFGRVHWFIPIHVFVDLFAVGSSYVPKTATLYIFAQPCTNLLSSLMDPGWNEKIEIGNAYIIKCTVSTPSMSFRYHVGRQTLYANVQLLSHVS